MKTFIVKILNVCLVTEFKRFLIDYFLCFIHPSLFNKTPIWYSKVKSEGYFTLKINSFIFLFPNWLLNYIAKYNMQQSKFQSKKSDLKTELLDMCKVQNALYNMCLELFCKCGLNMKNTCSVWWMGRRKIIFSP